MNRFCVIRQKKAYLCTQYTTKRTIPLWHDVKFLKKKALAHEDSAFPAGATTRALLDMYDLHTTNYYLTINTGQTEWVTT